MRKGDGVKWMGRVVFGEIGWSVVRRRGLAEGGQVAGHVLGE